MSASDRDSFNPGPAAGGASLEFIKSIALSMRVNTPETLWFVIFISCLPGVVVDGTVVVVVVAFVVAVSVVVKVAVTAAAVNSCRCRCCLCCC